MNLNIIKINVLVLVLVVASHGGVIEGFFETVHNTTSGLRQDVRNVWSRGKELVMGQEHKEEERGLIGGMIHSMHEKVHTLKEKFWNVDDIPSDSGLLWSWWNRMKQRLSRAKDYIIGNVEVEPKHIEDVPPKEETKLITDTLNSLFFENGTRRVHDYLFDSAVENLRKKLSDMRKGTTETTPTTENLGEGLIDVRFGDVGKKSKDIEDNAVGVGNDIYDKVNDNVAKLNDNTRQSIGAINDNVKENAREGLANVQSGYDKVSDGVNALKDGVSDAATKERDLLDNTYQKLDKDAKNLGDGLKKSADDIARLAYF